MKRIPVWVYIAVAGLILAVAFDYAMKKDAENLCSNDATAYDECGE